MRITCVIGAIGCGGAERMMVLLSRSLADRGHKVTLLTLDNSIADFYPLPDNVTRVRLHFPPFGKANFAERVQRFLLMRRTLKELRPQVVISFMTVSILGACLSLRIPYIYGDHLDVRAFPFSFKWQCLRKWLLRYASMVTVLSERDRLYLESSFPKWPVKVVYNPALPACKTPLPRPEFMPEGYKYVLAVGRLVIQKGFDRLLAAWKKIGNQSPWRMVIVGGGPEEEKLKKQAAEQGLTETVSFIPPLQEGLTAVYQYADILAMSSRTEGFPLVLLEAMAAGIPAVSFNCTGADVIIRPDEDGILVPQDDMNAFAEALSSLMNDEARRIELGKKAVEVVERFSLKKYVDTYEDLCFRAIS